MKTVSISELKTELAAAFAADVPVMVWGPGGVGKSAGISQAAAGYGGGFIDFRANLRDPVDLMGVPSIDGGRTRWNPPDEYPREGRDDERGVFLIDELPNAHRQTQSALYQLVLDRRLGDYALPKGWRVVAAGNRMQDHGGTYDMPLPLRKRFFHYEVKPSADDWRSWALANRIHPMVLSYIAWQNSDLYNVDPAAFANPTPRTWEMLSDALYADLDVPLVRLQAAIGQGTATKFLAYVTTFHKLPTHKDLMKDPKLVKPHLDKPDRLYALNDTVTANLRRKELDQAVKYMEQLPMEFQMLFVRTLARRDETADAKDKLNVMEHDGILKWVAVNAEKMYKAQ